MRPTNQKRSPRRRSHQELRAERLRLGARVREIRLASGVRFRTDMVRLMAQRLGQERAINRDRLRYIEDMGNPTAIELSRISQTLKCPLETFFEQPYGETSFSSYSDS